MASKYSMNDRPSWPRRAIVTAGEPYGNKGLHFGHVGGVFVPADFFARFLRARPRPSTTTTSAAISTAARALNQLLRFTTR